MFGIFENNVDLNNNVNLMYGWYVFGLSLSVYLFIWEKHIFLEGENKTLLLWVNRPWIMLKIISIKSDNPLTFYWVELSNFFVNIFIFGYVIREFSFRSAEIFIYEIELKVMEWTMKP